MKNDRPVIAVIDDDPLIVRILSRVLGENEFEVVVINEDDNIEMAINEHAVDLVLLDLNLKNHYGFEIARRLRSRNDLGVIMLTGSKDQVDKVVGLEIGVDDYIVKPFDGRELKARCRNVIRRINLIRESADNPGHGSRSATENYPVLNGFVLDKNFFRLVADDNREVKLTANEFALLEMFLSAGGQELSRERISTEIYSREWSPLSRSVDVLVSKLRRKLTNHDPALVILTVRGKGYKLVQSG